MRLRSTLLVIYIYRVHDAVVCCAVIILDPLPSVTWIVHYTSRQDGQTLSVCESRGVRFSTLKGAMAAGFLVAKLVVTSQTVSPEMSELTCVVIGWQLPRQLLSTLIVELEFGVVDRRVGDRTLEVAMKPDKVMSYRVVLRVDDGEVWRFHDILGATGNDRSLVVDTVWKYGRWQSCSIVTKVGELSTYV